MGYYDYMEELEDFTPFENLLSGIRDDVTRMKYRLIVVPLNIILNGRYKG